MATKYFALLTNIGAAKLAKATALGAQVEITKMAVGDGNGVLPTPNPAQTALTHEQRRAQLNMLTIDPVNTNQIIAEQVIPEDVGGWWIREIGLFDKDGDMVAIANCAETYKPQLQEGSGRVQVIRVILIVSSTEAVTLKIDPAVVLATRQYVDNKIIEVKSYADELMRTHEQSRNHPDATTSAKGFTQLNSSVTDDSEKQSSTPKAVKIAMDNANARLAKDRNLADLPNPALARQNLQLGDSSTKNTGTTANTVAAGDDARITGAMQKSQNGGDIPDVAKFLQNLGLSDVLHKGDGRLLTGTYVSDTEDAKSIGSRAAAGCQFMRAYKAPDAPDQVNYWQIITMTDVVSPTSQVVVLAITTTTNAFAVGYGTGQGITMWRSIPVLEGASFSGNISAPNIAAEFQLKAGEAIFRSDGDIYGSAWGLYGRLSGYLTGTFPKKTEVDEWLSTKANRQFITQVGLYQSDKTKPYMLHDDGTGVFLATKDMLSIASLGMTGWHKDNSTGLITQWGEATTSQASFRVNFPLAFPNACFGVTASDRSAFSAVGTSNRNTNGFDLNSSFNGTTNSFYIAKGI